MTNRLLELPALVGGNTQQAEAGDFRRIGFQRLIGQRLQLRRPLLTTGKIQRLRPLPEQLRRTSCYFNGTFESLSSLRRTLLSHIGATEEVPAFGRLGITFDSSFQARSHFLDGLRLISKSAGTLDIIDSTPMLIQAIPQQGHQQGKHQRNLKPQRALRRQRLCTFGIGQQLTGRLITASGKLLGIQRTCSVLSLQVLQALLIQGHVEGGTVFFSLELAPTQHGNQYKCQGCQQQQAGA